MKVGDLPQICSYLPGKGPQEAKKVYKGARAYAYCAVLWGASAGYALGALVLGARLRELGAKSGRVSPDLVLLYTDDVPLNYRMLLSKQWTLQRVAYIDGVATLYHKKVGRFDGVFTKLNAWNLVKYAKVLLLDLDTIPHSESGGPFRAADTRGDGSGQQRLAPWDEGRWPLHV